MSRLVEAWLATLAAITADRDEPLWCDCDNPEFVQLPVWQAVECRRCRRGQHPGVVR